METYRRKLKLQKGVIPRITVLRGTAGAITVAKVITCGKYEK